MNFLHNPDEFRAFCLSCVFPYIRKKAAVKIYDSFGSPSTSPTVVECNSLTIEIKSLKFFFRKLTYLSIKPDIIINNKKRYRVLNARHICAVVFEGQRWMDRRKIKRSSTAGVLFTHNLMMAFKCLNQCDQR